MGVSHDVSDFLRQNTAMSAAKMHQVRYGSDMQNHCKMTCQQFATYKVTNPKFIAIWLNGYHHGTRSDTVVDMQQLDADTRKMQDYCIKNPNTPLMQAVETVLKQ
jgi:hypothetical protein